MAGNLAIDHGRTEARRAQILQGSQVLFEDVADGPEAVAVSRSELRRIEAALDELPPKCREVLMLARVHGLEHKEIAQRMGVSVSLVEKYQLRALRHCRERLGS
jgi:RNA polymerase sigma factor (sigma-70 family)